MSALLPQWLADFGNHQAILASFNPTCVLWPVGRLPLTVRSETPRFVVHVELILQLVWSLFFYICLLSSFFFLGLQLLDHVIEVAAYHCDHDFYTAPPTSVGSATCMANHSNCHSTAWKHINGYRRVREKEVCVCVWGGILQN